MVLVIELVTFEISSFCKGEDHPICPVMLGDARLAVEFADEMLGKLNPLCLTSTVLCSYVWDHPFSMYT